MSQPDTISISTKPTSLEPMTPARGGCFVDTSALYAVFDSRDAGHIVSAGAWEELSSSDVPLFASSYVLVETTALLQNRLGVRAVMPSIRT